MATARLLGHYTHAADTAARYLEPARDLIPVTLAPPTPGTSPELLADEQAALQWLDTERPVLLAIQKFAADAGLDTHVWHLAWALNVTLHRLGRWHELVGTWQTALRAADRLPHPATAYAHRVLGQTMIKLGDSEQAHARLHHALHLYAKAADPTGQAHTHGVLAQLWERQSRSDRALGHAHQALALFHAASDLTGQAYALNAVGWCHALLGNHARALTHCQQSLTLHRQLADREGQAATWDSLGYAHHHLGHHTDATNCYHHAHTLYRDVGNRFDEAVTLTRLGDTHYAAGQPDQARAAWTTALDILTRLDHPDTDTVRAKLATLTR